MSVIGLWTPAEIRALREAHRMNLREFHRHTGLHADVICRWETGRHRPKPRSKAILDRVLRAAPLDVEERFLEILALESEQRVGSPA